MQPDLGINEVLDAVERELDLVAPHLRQWNQTYFRDARPRFINDLRTIERWYDSGEILEVGSLPYHLTMSLKMLGYEVIGLDLDPDRATQLIDRHQLRVEKCDIQHDPLPCWRRPVMDVVSRFAPRFGAYIVCVAEKPISGEG